MTSLIVLPFNLKPKSTRNKLRSIIRLKKEKYKFQNITDIDRIFIKPECLQLRTWFKRMAVNHYRLSIPKNLLERIDKTSLNAKF
jgi:hypothetical protein